MKVIPFVHEGLGNSSYLVELPGGKAALVDPDRIAGRYLAAADRAGLTITHVFETHLHADFISGVREIQAAVGAAVFASTGAELAFAHRPLTAGDTVAIEGCLFEAIASPGHTPEHLAFVFRQNGLAPALFSGGSLIVGGAARTDLIRPELTGQLSRAQFRTIHEAFRGLPDATALLPTHGGGSFCSAGAGGERSSTLGEERAANPVLALANEDAFAEWFPTTFPAAPSYFFRLRERNKRGPRLRKDLPVPKLLDPEEFEVASRTSAVVDVRPQAEFLRGHVPGALSNAFRDAFATWLGWLVPLDTPLLLVLGPEPLETVVDECMLVGHENVVGILRGGMPAWEATGRPTAQAELAEAGHAAAAVAEGAVALDVREPAEFEAGHIPGSVHIPLGKLAERMALLPRSVPIVTYCGHGERSASALSILQRAGFQELVNLNGGIDAWKEAGYEVTSQPAEIRP